MRRSSLGWVFLALLSKFRGKECLIQVDTEGGRNISPLRHPRRDVPHLVFPETLEELLSSKEGGAKSGEHLGEAC